MTPRDEYLIELAGRDPRYRRHVPKQYRHLIRPAVVGVTPKATKTVAESPVEKCARRSELPRRTEGCNTCAGRVELKVFACSAFGECTIAKPAANVAGCCKGCKSYQQGE